MLKSRRKKILAVGNSTSSDKRLLPIPQINPIPAYSKINIAENTCFPRLYESISAKQRNKPANLSELFEIAWPPFAYIYIYIHEFQ